MTTTLQDSVRLRKLPARNYFACDDDTASPSIVVTSLAARAYAEATPENGALNTYSASSCARCPT